MAMPLVLATVIVQYVSALIQVTFAFLWFIAGRKRGFDIEKCAIIRQGHKCQVNIWSKGLQILSNDNYTRQDGALLEKLDANSPKVSSGQVDQPQITMIMPVKGYSPYFSSNWQSFVSQCYPGKRELLFVVDTMSDVCVNHIRKLQLANQDEDIRIVCAGLATQCSQKVHNVVAGIQSASRQSTFALVLDSDIELHCCSLKDLVETVQTSGSFMGTGFPFDLPPCATSLPAYIALSYHLPMHVLFQLLSTCPFAWGGCMLLPLADLRSDRYHMLAALRNGGYSDDMTISALCAAHRLKIAVPLSATLPSPLQAKLDYRSVWDYLTRQLVTMDTYSDLCNRVINHSLFVVHLLLSSAMVAGTAASTAALALKILEVLLQLGPASCCQSLQEQLLEWKGIVKPLQQAGYTWLLCAFLAGSSLRFLMQQIAGVVAVHYPAYARSQLLARFNFVLLYCGWQLGNAVLVAGLLKVASSCTMTWAGVHYWRRRGKVVRVLHQKGASETSEVQKIDKGGGTGASALINGNSGIAGDGDRAKSGDDAQQIIQ